VSDSLIKKEKDMNETSESKEVRCSSLCPEHKHMEKEFEEIKMALKEIQKTGPRVELLWKAFIGVTGLMGTCVIGAILALILKH
jgi:hypothetical protein